MARRLTPLLLLLAPAPAWAAGGASATTIIGSVAVLVVACAILIAVKRPWGLAAAALLGVAISGYLAHQHDLAAGASACNQSETWNCDAVNRSVYSELFGLPIALFGMAFYVAMAWLALRNTLEKAERAPAVMTVLAAFAVVIDVFLAWASSQVGAWCALCVASWVLNALLLVGSYLLWHAQRQPLGSSLLNGLKGEAWSVAVVGLLTLVIGRVTLASGPDAGGAAPGAPASLSVDDLGQFYEQARGTVALDGTEPVYGETNAVYTLVEWADFECPHCAEMAIELKAVVDTNKDVRLVFKNYPISEKCNQFVEGERHLDACNAAAAGECARLQGRFWELNHEMFKNQGFLGKEDIRFMVKQLALDMTVFEACMADPSTAESVRQDVAAGGTAGIQGTPSIFLRGAFGDQWVRVTGGIDAMNAIFKVARTGAALPAPKPPTDH